MRYATMRHCQGPCTSGEISCGPGQPARLGELAQQRSVTCLVGHHCPGEAALQCAIQAEKPAESDSMSLPHASCALSVQASTRLNHSHLPVSRAPVSSGHTPTRTMVKGARIRELDDHPATSSESSQTQKERISQSKRQEYRAHIYSEGSRQLRITPGGSSILLPKSPVKRTADQLRDVQANSQALRDSTRCSVGAGSDKRPLAPVLDLPSSVGLAQSRQLQGEVFECQSWIGIDIHRG
jgi:hypothetical protein